MLSKAAAVQRQLNSITAVAARNPSLPSKNAPLSKAEQEHEKRPRAGVGAALDAEVFQCANLSIFSIGILGIFINA